MEFDRPRLNRFYQYCYALTRHEQNAYDLLQGAIEKFLKQSSNQASNHAPNQDRASEAYLYRVIRNTFIDQYRHQQRFEHEPFDEEQHSVDFDIATLESLSIDVEHVNKLMAEISTTEREILFLWAVEGYSTQEVADLLNTPKSTVLSRIFRLRKKLQNYDHSHENIDGGIAL